MKQFALYCLTAVYFLAFSQPFMPYLQYALNKDFIASEWCVNRETKDSDCEGRCYRNSALTRSTENSTQGSPQTQIEVLSLAPHGPQGAVSYLFTPVYCWVDAVVEATYRSPMAELVSPPPQA